LKNRKYGASADRLDIPSQMNLFDDRKALRLEKAKPVLEELSRCTSDDKRKTLLPHNF